MLILRCVRTCSNAQLFMRVFPVLCDRLHCQAAARCRGCGGTNHNLCNLCASLVVGLADGKHSHSLFSATLSGVVQRIPNIDFWRDLPTLVKEGVLFAVGKVKSCAGGGSSTSHEQLA